MTKRDGGPAFPITEEQGLNGYAEPGMTLREYFAGQALIAIGNEPIPTGVYVAGCEKRVYPSDEDYLAGRAKWAVAQADALLQALAQGEQS